jgi:hypothetical protein
VRPRSHERRENRKTPFSVIEDGCSFFVLDLWLLLAGWMAKLEKRVRPTMSTRSEHDRELACRRWLFPALRPDEPISGREC